MVVAIKAPLPSPRSTTARGRAQQREATSAELALTRPDLKSVNCIDILLSFWRTPWREFLSFTYMYLDINFLLSLVRVQGRTPSLSP
jgi:hypothetical protein